MLDVLMPVSKIDWSQEAIASIAAASLFAKVKTRLIIVLTRSDIFLSLDNHSQNEFLEIITVKSYGANYETALTAGSEYLQGQYVALMNDDDLCTEDRFKIQLSVLIDTNSDVCIGKMKKFGQLSKKLSFNNQLYFQYHHLFLLLGPYGANATWMMKRNWWESKIGKLELAGEWDWAFALKYFPDATYHYCPETLYFYRQHKDQTSRKIGYRSNLASEMGAPIEEYWRKAIGEETSRDVINILAFPYIAEGVKLRKLREITLIYIRFQRQFGFISFWFTYQYVLRVILAFTPHYLASKLGMRR